MRRSHRAESETHPPLLQVLIHKTLGHLGGIWHRKTHNTNMISIPINDTHWTLESQLVSLRPLLSHLTRVPTSAFFVSVIECLLNSYWSKKDLLRCARGGLNFNYVKWEQGIKMWLWNPCNCKSTSLVLLTRCSSDDDTPQAPTYTTN